MGSMDTKIFAKRVYMNPIGHPLLEKRNQSNFIEAFKKLYHTNACLKLYRCPFYYDDDNDDDDYSVHVFYLFIVFDVETMHF